MTPPDKVPFLDLQAQVAPIRAELDAAIADVVDNTAFILGDRLAAFERDFAGYCGCGEAVGVDSGTQALHLILRALGVGPGDEVVTVPNTFIATVEAIAYTGATPVFVDVDPDTWLMDPARLADAITPRTKAVMPVHLGGGHPAGRGRLPGPRRPLRRAPHRDARPRRCLQLLPWQEPRRLR